MRLIVDFQLRANSLEDVLGKGRRVKSDHQEGGGFLFPKFSVNHCLMYYFRKFIPWWPTTSWSRLPSLLSALYPTRNSRNWSRGGRKFSWKYQCINVPQGDLRRNSPSNKRTPSDWYQKDTCCFRARNSLSKYLPKETVFKDCRIYVFWFVNSKMYALTTPFEEVMPGHLSPHTEILTSYVYKPCVM